MRHVALFVLAGVLAYAPSAIADLASPVRASGKSYVVRQGYQQLAVYGSHEDCEGDALRRTNNAGPARRIFQLRSGSGAVIRTLPSLDECLAAPIDNLTSEGSRRPIPPRTSESWVNSCVAQTSYSSSFQPPTCIATHNFLASYVTPTAPPPPVCSETPSTETRTCPPGTSGTWSQTSTVSAYPQCAVTWAPSSPPPDRCPPIVVPTAPVVTLSVDQLIVSITWSGAVPNRSYALEKCRGAACTNFAPLACTSSSSYSDPLPAGATARYRVRGMSESGCTGTAGPFSNAPQVTMGGSPTPIGTAELRWTPGAVNASGPIAGFYVVYGTTPNLDRQIIVQGGDRTTYTVTGLAAGTWYFAVKQYTANFAQVSDLSPIRSKTVR
jgi:hypothetical protein